MHSYSQKSPDVAPAGPRRAKELEHEDDVEVDVDNDPGNEDPGSQFDRDATVPLIDPRK